MNELGGCTDTHCIDSEPFGYLPRAMAFAHAIRAWLTHLEFC